MNHNFLNETIIMVRYSNVANW